MVVTSVGGYWLGKGTGELVGAGHSLSSYLGQLARQVNLQSGSNVDDTLQYCEEDQQQ